MYPKNRRFIFLMFFTCFCGVLLCACTRSDAADEPERQEMTAVYLGQSEEGYLMRFKVIEDAQLAGQEIEMWPAYGLDLSDMQAGDHMRLIYIIEDLEEIGEQRFSVMQGELLETDNT